MQSNASIITSIPLGFIIMMIYSILLYSKRKYAEFDKSLENIR